MNVWSRIGFPVWGFGFRVQKGSGVKGPGFRARRYHAFSFLGVSGFRRIQTANGAKAADLGIHNGRVWRLGFRVQDFGVRGLGVGSII